MEKVSGVLAIVLLCALNASGQESQRIPMEFREGTQFETQIDFQIMPEQMTTAEALTVDVVIKNISNRSRRLPAERIELLLKVTTTDGKECRSTLMRDKLRQITASTGHFHTMKPGESLKIRCYLNEIYDLTLPGFYNVELSWKDLVGYKADGVTVLADIYRVGPIKFRVNEPERVSMPK